MVVLVIENGNEEDVRKLYDCFVFQSMMYKFSNFCVKSFGDCSHSEIKVIFLFETDSVFINLIEDVRMESGVEFVNECFSFNGTFGQMVNRIDQIDIFSDVSILEIEFS